MIEPHTAPHAGTEITRDEMLRRLRDPSLAILDVLPRHSYDEIHIAGAMSAPLAALAEQAPSLVPDRAKEIAVYCGSFT